MTDTTDTSETPIIQTPASLVPAIESSQEDVCRLLDQLQDPAPVALGDGKTSENTQLENQLAMVRLGIATSLFFSLRTKHTGTAAHSLRVALMCSAWAEHLGLDSETRDRIEVASLLHDLGKIGIPDRILRKPSRLTVEEQLTMDCCPELACSILRGCTNDSELLNIVLYSNTWFESRRHDSGPSRDAIPLGARMLAIANAFDAMTSEQVYRSRMSHEKAIEQLIQLSGTQFDPELVVDFARMVSTQSESDSSRVANRWLNQFKSNEARSHWAVPVTTEKQLVEGHLIRRETRFHSRLLNDLKDGVVFTDNEGTISHWNGTMVRLTGISSEAMVGKTWNMKTLKLRNEEPSQLAIACPLEQCLDESAPICRSMQLPLNDSHSKPVEVRVSPVYNADGPGKLGAVIIVHDKSDHTELQEQLETLHHISTLDALTGIANRAHFDHTLEAMTAETASGGQTFSLVICDIDFFKQVNDVHGHPAGDEALKSFADVLRSHSRDGDLVARYGGEEFLLLARSCDSVTASERAEAIRDAVQQTMIPCLGNRSVTASFGVTEFQTGDSPATVLSRADRALLKAKDSGRNRVITIGASNKVVRLEDRSDAKRGWFSWFESKEAAKIEFFILTPVPSSLAIEKLKGFLADHDAEILNVCEKQVSLKLNAFCPRGGRRRVDQRIAMSVQLTLSDAHPDETKLRGHSDHTKVHVNLVPIRKRDRRRQEFQPTVEQLIASLRNYLMGELLLDQ